ncbi:type III-A CRISPR-associated protein Cas10/Csm1 [Halomonas campisalis]|uniref:CRISPR system single-strand-specific deoxyribonuclease Cas10/Csm1 (subtype III-A) n=1 Tax=Billgrantia campisalis TaxID=74661 RepID=A0ABS9PCA0_9GAMM|nr:type III-A CRISPR-associated protein Cas10/Csm1 [Halomonas campisalis]MCG6659398.1 type III-A CRISPR-associated protein Cas10/Csm1 [Halomonas campisalis]MDR5864000.1 type III-A CRISPR-associated protein Cas10/Csm1 [Halomonas campisalis]
MQANDSQTVDQALLQASSRVAFAGLVHDLGKLGERARVEAPKSHIDANVHLYCPFNKEKGFHSHKHAAYTALCLDRIERHLPHLTGDSVAPFASWKSQGADDSLLNAAAMHHKPDTLLQWVIATADRIASGFERETFAEYNKAEERNHYRTRLLSLFEPLYREEQASAIDQLKYRYPLAPLNPESLFPVARDQAEPDNNGAAQAEYLALWEQFCHKLERIPPSHRKQWPLWLDHFDSLWMETAQSIPAATAFNSRPDVSLYDHSHTVAAMATALWRYHHERGDDPEQVRKAMQYRQDWDEAKFLLIQGDFFGIQDFIFSAGGETRKRANKLLRGKSFYVSLLCELAALRLLEALALPATSQITNAAGKFMLVAPNTPRTQAAIARVATECQDWFGQHSFHLSGIGLATTEACANDFLAGKGGQEPPFRHLMQRLFAALETAKYQRLSLTDPEVPIIQSNFLSRFDQEKGICALDGRSPAEVRLERDNTQSPWVSRLARDQVQIGEWLAQPRHQRLVITRGQPLHDGLTLAIFGYGVGFTGPGEASGQFGALAKQGELVRCWDISLPTLDDTSLFHGYARRFINAYVPLFGSPDGYEQQRYGDHAPLDEIAPGKIKTLEHLACEDRGPLLKEDHWVGQRALHILKGDVDDLGLLFERGLAQPSFARMAALSRQMHFFYSLWLPAWCARHAPNTYTVFAGGDDFFLIGPWKQTTRLALQMRQQFERFAAHNPGLHFSAGLLQVKPGAPIQALAEQSEQALELAKAEPGKDHVTLYGQTLGWPVLAELLHTSERLLAQRREAAVPLSTGYLYGLLELSQMASEAQVRPEAGLWRSYLSYRTQRNVIDKLSKRPGETRDAYAERQRQACDDVLSPIAQGITQHRQRFQIAIQHLLYQLR